MDLHSRQLRPTRFEAWLERRFPPCAFGVVFGLLFASFVVMTLGIGDPGTRVLTVVLEGLTLLLTLVAARVGRLLFRIAGLVVAMAIITAVASIALGKSDSADGWFNALNVLLIASAPVAIAFSLYRRPVVDIHTVMGAICIFLLIGLLYAFLYAAIGAIGSAQFFVQTSDPGLPISLYYSFVTLTTVGYGDYTTATNLGHTLSVTEALLGQLYLVTVIAVLVSRLTPARRAGDDLDGADPSAAADAAIPADPAAVE